MCGGLDCAEDAKNRRLRGEGVGDGAGRAGIGGGGVYRKVDWDPLCGPSTIGNVGVGIRLDSSRPG